MLRQLPNSLTILRIAMVAPMGWLVLREQYSWALIMGATAGFTDALDGYLARRLDARTRLGAVLDPLADKALVTVAFICFAMVGLIGWPLAALVIARDLVILSGACCYYLLIGPVEMSPLRLSKWNMAVQIGFCVLVLAAQLVPDFPAALLSAASWVVVAIGVASGAGYVLLWSRKALQQGRRGSET